MQAKVRKQELLIINAQVVVGTKRNKERFFI